MGEYICQCWTSRECRCARCVDSRKLDASAHDPCCAFRIHNDRVTRGDKGPCPCELCRPRRVSVALAELGRQLGIAAGLHRAFMLGAWYGWDEQTQSCIGEGSELWAPNAEGRAP